MKEDQFAKDIKDTEKYNDTRLAELRGGIADGTPRAILIDKEFEHRTRLKQHELDLKLIAGQVRWMKFAVFATIFAALLGAIVGAILQETLQ